MADGGARIGGVFSDSAVGRRLALCAELNGLDRGRERDNVRLSVQLRQRGHAMLRLLLPGEAGAGKPTDALYAKGSATRLFADEIEAAKQASDAGKLRSALLLSDLMKMAGHVNSAGWKPSDGNIVWPEIPAEFAKPDPGIKYKEDSPALPVVNEAKALGALPDGLVESAKRAIAENPLVRMTVEELAKIDPETIAARDAASKMASEAYKALPQGSGPEFEAQWAAYRELSDKRYKAEVAVAELSRREAVRRQSVIAASVGDYVAELVGSSSVTEEQAAEWANQQVVITANAVKRLKKQGYAPEQVVKDAAEFYRFTRGRIEKVVIDSRGDRRANAGSIDAHGTAGRINLGSQFDKRVLWHELGHHIEADPVAAMAARLFIRLRSEDGGKVHSLRKLTGHKGYHADEKAFRNGFFHPYVGKVYAHGSTEVFSMGVESFSDPFLLAKRIAVDPETFEFVTGYLKSPKTTLQRLHLAMRQSMRENSEGAVMQAVDFAQAKIKREAAKLTSFTESKVFPAVVDGEVAEMVTRIYGALVGYFAPEASEGEHYLMMLGKGRHPTTGRMGKGFRFVRITARGSISHLRTTIPAAEPEIARLFLWYWRQYGFEPTYENVAAGSLTVSEE